METALAKFEVAKMSAGKKTPIMTMPLDFPALSNESVTIFDVTTNYPVTTNVMKEYLSDYMNINASMIVVRKPGEPTEEYQDNMQVAQKSEYANKLMDIEYKDAPKVKPEEFHSTQANMSLLKELLKDREANKDQPKEKENIQSKEEKGTPSPLSKATNKHPDPKRK
jgi:phosphoketolase